MRLNANAMRRTSCHSYNYPKPLLPWVAPQEERLLPYDNRTTKQMAAVAIPKCYLAYEPRGEGGLSDLR